MAPSGKFRPQVFTLSDFAIPGGCNYGSYFHEYHNYTGSGSRGSREAVSRGNGVYSVSGEESVDFCDQLISAADAITLM